MKNIYHLLGLFNKIKSQRIKLAGIYTLHILNKRYIGIFIDPVLACNFRCKMCYFSDTSKSITDTKKLESSDCELIAKALFDKALKLQIGCGTEPTLYKNVTQLITLGKKHKIPHISLTTNGYLVTKEKLNEYVEAGLDEITLSLHGLKKETYEFFMTNGKFERIPILLENIGEIKKKYPHFKLRINYTINEDNLYDLQLFDSIFQETKPDILQLRPIQKIGDSNYSNFDLNTILDNYDLIIKSLIDGCKEKGIICIAPSKENINTIKENNDIDNSIEEATYCYISPKSCWKDNFDYKKDNFNSFCKREKVGFKILKAIFSRKNKNKKDLTIKMNYTIE